MMNQFFRGFGAGHPGGHRHFRHGHHGWGGRGWGPGWGGRARRGEMKFLILEALEAGPRHGYDIIGAIEAKRGFRPSPGSIYPTLQMLEDGGFVSGGDAAGKRVYTITDAGRALLAQREPEGGGEDEEPDARLRLRAAAAKLGAAVLSARGSDDATLEKIRTILERARKEVYGVLASDES